MRDIFEEIRHETDVSLKKYSTFRIGGNAGCIFFPKTVADIRDIIAYCKQKGERYMLLGNGSNILFADEGYDGIIIHINKDMSGIERTGTRLHIGAGAALGAVAVYARENSLTGMEFAAGIPGTIGGAVVMNAGAYGGEMKDIVEYVDVLDETGEVQRYTCEMMSFGYRTSIVDDGKIVVAVGLLLSEGERETIDARMKELNAARLEKQPLSLPSAGSTFKRPKGHFAAKLIDEAGLRGYSVGGAGVSTKHCGFVVNNANATCKDVLAVIEHVTEVVYEKFGVKLEPEVKIIR